MKKLKTFDSIYFKDKSHFEEDGTQNYLVFPPIKRYFKVIAGVGNGRYIYYWKSKLPDETINSIKTSDYRITPYLSYYNTDKITVRFDGGCLKQDQFISFHGGIVNFYIVYDISKNINISGYPTLENCSFGAVKLTKNADIEKYGYSGYGIGFDRHGSFSFSGTRLGRNVMIFGVDMISSTKIEIRKKDILILGKGPTQGLEHTQSAEKMYSINFTEHNKKVCLSLHYNKENSYLFVNGTEIIKFKSKNTEILSYPLSLENISKDWSVDNMKKKQNLVVPFMILAWIMMLLQLMIF